MVQYSAVDLDAALSALADSTRRGVLEELGRAEASLTQLAEKIGQVIGRDSLDP